MGDRHMYQGDWSCCDCQAEIKELPFEPRDGANLRCLECLKKKSNSAPEGERKKFEGNWSCSGCGGAITSLPFEPRETGNLKCYDCFKKGAA